MATRLETKPKRAGTALDTGRRPRECAGMEASQALTKMSQKTPLLRLRISETPCRSLGGLDLARIDLR